MQEDDTAPQTGLPLFAEDIPAGFPSPVRGELTGMLDINHLCIENPPATYFVRARGESMTGAGITDGDILVVDRSLEAAHGDIVVAAVSGGFTVKRLEINDDSAQLVPENPVFSPIPLKGEEKVELFGVVTWVLKKTK